MNNEVILDVNKLTISLARKNLEQLDLVHEISFEIRKAEVLGLVGESGSGKSLSSLAILQLLSDKLFISGGTILFEGSDIVTAKEKQLRAIRGKKISMIFQEPMSSLNPLMICGKQVDEMILTHEGLSSVDAKLRTLDLFAKVKLPDSQRAYDSYPHQLSGGQLQRIMIAMALGCNPKILIADECTTALDVTVQKEILQLLRELNKEYGISILFISHDLDVIAEIADRVMVMKNGKILEIATVEQIFKSPKHPYTQQLIASKPPLDIPLKILPRPTYFDNEDASASQFYKENLKSDVDIAERKKFIKQAETILEVKDLSKFYSKDKNFWGKPTAYVKAVDHVSFSIKKGETLGLVGESGCGKSTLSKALLRLIDVDSGDVKYKGESLFGLRPKEMRKKRKEIQYIFQDPFSSLNPRLSIGYAIQEPMKVHGILDSSKQRQEKVVELLEVVGLEADHYKRFPHQFSGGQRQRICIARALSMDPDFIVCDEIVSALDVSVQAQVLNLLIELRQKFDLSLLFVSHDLSIVKFISDRLLVMQEGHIVEEGWADEIYNSPRAEYTKTLLNAIPGSTKAF